MPLSGNKHVRFLLTLLYVALSLLGIYFFFKYVFSWFLPFIIAFFLSRIIEPPVSFLTRRLKIPRPVASALCTLLVISIVGLFLVLTTRRAIYELRTLSAVLPSLFDRVSVTLEDLAMRISSVLPDNISFAFTDILKGWNNFTIPSGFINDILSRLTTTAASLPQILISVIATIVATYFISSDYRSIGNFIALQVSEDTMNKIRRIRAYWFQTLGRWLQAQLFLICVTFTELAIGFIIIGIPYAGVLAVFIAMIDALPILGTGTLLIPWALFNLFTGDYATAASIIALYGVIALVRNSIEPKIVGQRIGLHPLVTLMCMYVGLRTMGFFGMFVVPLIVLTLNQLKEWDYIKIWK